MAWSEARAVHSVGSEMPVRIPVMTVSVDDEHIAGRPSWDCRRCGRPWPCDAAREALIIEMDQVGLAIYMWVVLEEAAWDMPHGLAPELYERFLSWTH